MNFNLSEYSDPAIYDDENFAFEPDGPYLARLATQLGGPLLEIGCGTGRLTIPLAEQGFSITGLDVVPGMLERARHKAKGLAIEWIEADARDFQLGRQFNLIFTMGCFQHFLERADQEAVLRNVREHLTAEGRFVFVVFFPSLDSLEDAAEKEWFRYTNHAGQDVVVSGTDEYDPLRQIKTETAIRRWINAAGEAEVRYAPLQQRFFFPQELDALLHYNGLEVVGRYGDFDERPLAADDGIMIFVCRKTG
ncbi:MAG TPA: class I SAM-dependent methyltransferase [Aggregatilineaceae bacterium]|nr:class I SAM-dependent methyltransferase [Aggregatilineaceae bacterium]